MSKAAVIGGGAAGMMAAVMLARRGYEVHLFEKNEKVGKKLYITGKGRCNLTNNCEENELLNHVMTNPRFMYSAFSAFDAQDVMAFFETEGLTLKTERGNRVFPSSDKSSDVIRTLEKAMKKEKVNVHLRTTVRNVVVNDYESSEEVSDREGRKGGKKAACGCACGIVTEPGGFFPADAVLVATGGLSYQTTGSTGDGYRFAQETGHKVTECEPSLVPLITAEEYIPEMQGLSLKNTGLTIKSGKKTVYSDFGEMMFTHNGVTGPMILSASAVISKQLKKGPLNAFLDLKPALTPEKLDARILRDFGEAPNRQFRNVVSGLLPSSMVPVMIRLSGIPEDKRIHDITKEERLRFEGLVKNFPFTITGKGDFKEAVITKGGVSVKDINPATMESKIVDHLYFIGEVIDVDALTGGFNLQIAWSTAYLAAMSV